MTNLLLCTLMPGLKSSVRKAALAATHVAAVLPSLPTTRRKEGTPKVIEREGKQAIIMDLFMALQKSKGNSFPFLALKGDL